MTLENIELINFLSFFFLLFFETSDANDFFFLNKSTRHV